MSCWQYTLFPPSWGRRSKCSLCSLNESPLYKDGYTSLGSCEHWLLSNIHAIHYGCTHVRSSIRTSLVPHPNVAHCCSHLSTWDVAQGCAVPGHHTAQLFQSLLSMRKCVYRRIRRIVAQTPVD